MATVSSFDSDCEHASTVEVYRGIFKCSGCGEFWDEATTGEQEERQISLAEGRRQQHKRAAKVKEYKRRNYRRRK